MRSAYPNPFNPVVHIEYTIPEPGGITTIEVYDVAGRYVTTLQNGTQTAGSYATTWDGTTHNGQPAASGLDLYQLQVGTRSVSGKLVLVK